MNLFASYYIIACFGFCIGMGTNELMDGNLKTALVNYLLALLCLPLFVLNLLIDLSK